MKQLSLFALGEVNMEDLCILLRWIMLSPSGNVSLDQIKRSPPIRTSKISSALKLLEQFGFVGIKQGRYSISAPGEEFLASGTTVRRAVLRLLLSKFDPVQRIIEVLGTSSTGRIPKKMVNESFGLIGPMLYKESEILAFIRWAEACELFGFDRKEDEIFRIDPHAPRGPIEKPELRVS
jgi:hypothetical protein